MLSFASCSCIMSCKCHVMSLTCSFASHKKVFRQSRFVYSQVSNCFMLVWHMVITYSICSLACSVCSRLMRTLSILLSNLCITFVSRGAVVSFFWGRTSEDLTSSCSFSGGSRTLIITTPPSCSSSSWDSSSLLYVLSCNWLSIIYFCVFSYVPILGSVLCCSFCFW